MEDHDALFCLPLKDLTQCMSGRGREGTRTSGREGGREGGEGRAPAHSAASRKAFLGEEEDVARMCARVDTQVLTFPAARCACVRASPPVPE